MPNDNTVRFKIGTNIEQGVVVYMIGDTRCVLTPANARSIGAALIEASNKLVPPEKLN